MYKVTLSICFLRSSKSHAERLKEANLATLLDHLPIRNQFRVAGNGRLVQNDGAFFHNPHSYSNRTQSSVPQNRSHDGFDRSYPTPSNQGPPIQLLHTPDPHHPSKTTAQTPVDKVLSVPMHDKKEDFEEIPSLFTQSISSPGMYEDGLLITKSFEKPYYTNLMQI